MIIRNTSRALIIGFMFTLLTGPVSAMRSNCNVIEENLVDKNVSYRDIFWQLKTQYKNSAIIRLQEEERAFCQNFFVQLIKSYNEKDKDFEELGRRRFVDIEAEYLSKKLLFTTATNDLGQLMGALFFYSENNGTEIIIKSLITDNIEDTTLYQQLCTGMIQLIMLYFPDTRKIRILESTVPQNLKETLEALKFSYKFINRPEDRAWIVTPVFEFQVSSWKQWCNIL